MRMPHTDGRSLGKEDLEQGWFLNGHGHGPVAQNRQGGKHQLPSEPISN